LLTLLYHNLVSSPVTGLPVAGAQVSVETFAAQIRKFRRQLLHPKEAHDQLIKGKSPRGVLVTFDDGAEGITTAGEILAEAGGVGVAFVCPGSLDSGVWFYRLADTLCRSKRSAINWQKQVVPIGNAAEKRAAYKLISTHLFDLSPEERERWLSEVLVSLSPVQGDPHPALRTHDEQGLRKAAATGGLVFANHSWSHPNLTSLRDVSLKKEIEHAHDWLESSGLPTVNWFAFPRGKYDQRVRDAVRRVCPLAFGASPLDRDVLPRVGLYAADRNPMRLRLKTMFEGRFMRLLARG
jgi:peptidoglycan/xylan/chitin deacetylase (PgdA/CDA1 family)